MNPIVTLGLFFAFVVGAVTIALIVLKNNRKVPVVGINVDAGTLEIRKLSMNKFGAATWRDKQGGNTMLALGQEFAFRGKKGPAYLADLSEGKGCVMGLEYTDANEAATAYPMSGKRLWSALFSGGLKEIADSAKTDFNKTLTILMIGGGTALLLILGALLYAIKLLQDAQNATGGGVPTGL